MPGFESSGQTSQTYLLVSCRTSQRPRRRSS
jgi:hypothetical protein